MQNMSISLDLPLFLSIPDAAQILGIDPRRLRDAIEADQIPSLRLGKQFLVSRRVIERLATEGNWSTT